jgi:hypothetical protein
MSHRQAVDPLDIPFPESVAVDDSSMSRGFGAPALAARENVCIVEKS